MLGVGGVLAIRRTTRKLAADPDQRENTFCVANNMLLKVTRGHLYIAGAYMANVIVIAIIDVVMATLLFSKHGSSDPDNWNMELLIALAILAGYALLVTV